MSYSSNVGPTALATAGTLAAAASAVVLAGATAACVSPVARLPDQARTEEGQDMEQVLPGVRLELEPSETQGLLDQTLADQQDVETSAAGTELSLEDSDESQAYPDETAGSSVAFNEAAEVSSGQEHEWDTAGLLGGSTEAALTSQLSYARITQWTIVGWVCFWVSPALLCWFSNEGLIENWYCMPQFQSPAMATGSGSAGAYLESDGVEEAEYLLHATRNVMFWLTFGWPALMVYWGCVSVAFVVHRVHRKPEDSAFPRSCVFFGAIGLGLLAYFVYAMLLWFQLMFIVFGHTGDICVAADGEEAGHIALLMIGLRVYYALALTLVGVICCNWLVKFTRTRGSASSFAAAST